MDVSTKKQSSKNERNKRTQNGKKFIKKENSNKELLYLNAKRFQEAIKNAGYKNPAQFAEDNKEKMSISRSKISKWITDKRYKQAIDKRDLSLVAQKLGVNERWLVNLSDNMFPFQDTLSDNFREKYSPVISLIKSMGFQFYIERNKAGEPNCYFNPPGKEPLLINNLALQYLTETAYNHVALVFNDYYNSNLALLDHIDKGIELAQERTQSE